MTGVVAAVLALVGVVSVAHGLRASRAPLPPPAPPKAPELPRPSLDFGPPRVGRPFLRLLEGGGSPPVRRLEDPMVMDLDEVDFVRTVTCGGCGERGQAAAVERDGQVEGDPPEAWSRVGVVKYSASGAVPFPRVCWFCPECAEDRPTVARVLTADLRPGWATGHQVLELEDEDGEGELTIGRGYLRVRS